MNGKNFFMLGGRFSFFRFNNNANLRQYLSSSNSFNMSFYSSSNDIFPNNMVMGPIINLAPQEEREEDKEQNARDYDKRYHNGESSVLKVSNRNIMLNKVKDPHTLEDAYGNEHIDFAAGIGVNSFGNLPDPTVANIVTTLMGEQIYQLSRLPDARGILSTGLLDYLERANKKNLPNLGHISSSHNSCLLEVTSKRLVEKFGDKSAKIFWANSGTEANETAIKMARFYQTSLGNKDKTDILTFEGAFHGRTLGSLAATGKYTEGFGPILGGFSQVEYNNIEAVKQAFESNPNLGAIMVEPIQGEGGINVPSPEFLQELRKIADEYGALLIFDEVQCGIGRVGTFFAHDHPKLGQVKPDIVVMAKALGAGVVATSATIASGKVSVQLTGPDNSKIFSHGNTHSGSPVSVVTADSVIDMLEDPQYMGKDVDENMAYFKESLVKLQKKYPDYIKDTRGLGAMLAIGIDEKITNVDLVILLRNNGLLTMPTGRNGIRFLPALNTPKDLFDKAIEILDKTIAQEIVKQKKQKTPLHQFSYEIVGFDKNNPKLLEYFALRKQVYDDQGLHYYPDNNPGQYDNHKDNKFILVTDETGKIVAGRRFIIHEPNSAIKLHAEINTQNNVAEMLPHIQGIEKYKYAELGGMVVATELQGNGLSKELYKDTFIAMKELNIDFVLSEVVPKNVNNFIKSCNDNDLEQVVYRSDLQGILDGSGDKILMCSFKTEDELPLLSEEMKEQNIGMPPTQAELNAIEKNQKDNLVSIK